MVNNIFIHVHVLTSQIWSTIYLYMYMYLYSKYGQQYIDICTCTYIPNMVNSTCTKVLKYGIMQEHKLSHLGVNNMSHTLNFL